MTKSIGNLLNLCFLSLSIFSGTVSYAQEGVDLRLLTNRFIRENPDVAAPSHWSSGISVEVLGTKSAQMAMYASSKVFTFATFAKTDVAMGGEVNEWFSPDRKLSAGANYVVVFFDLPENHDGNLTGDSLKLDLSNAKPEVSEIFQAGLPRRGVGCFSDWRATSNNIIESFVLIVDSGLSEGGQTNCINFFVPLSFGVHPEVTKMRLPDFAGRNGKEADPFYDNSESLLAVGLAAYCREDLNINSIGCADALVEKIYSNHSDLVVRD